MQERLHKLLAEAGVASRRKAEELIRQGRISVNNRVVTTMGIKADPEIDTISFDGAPIHFEEKIYILLNKPAGYLCTLHDPEGRPIITDLVTNIRQRIFPVGRLDYDSEGALIMTNDGRLGHFMQHPRFEVNKTYKTTVKGMVTQEKLQQLRKGILLDGKMTHPAKITLLHQKTSQSTFEVIIHEGRKRQVRKMFATVGCPVTRLVRTAYGKLELGNLASGKWKKLTKNDLKKLFSGKIPFTINKITD